VPARRIDAAGLHSADRHSRRPPAAGGTVGPGASRVGTVPRIGNADEGGVSPGQAPLIRYAGWWTPTDTRQRVDQEARLTPATRVSRKAALLTHGRQPEAVVDPAMEAKRLTAELGALASRRVTGETQFRDKKTGRCSELFSWM